MGTNFINLREPGSTHTLRVQSVSINKSGKWPDYEFTDGTNTVQVPQKAADRQLERLNVKSALELVGANLCISRTEKVGDNGKPFWDLQLVNGGAVNPAPSKRLPPPPLTASQRHDAEEYESDYQGDEGVAHPRPRLTGKRPVTLGAPIAGMDESAYEETPAIPAWHKVPPPDEDGFERFSAAIDSLNPDAQPALTPREVKAQEAAANGQSPVDKLVANFADLYAQTLGALVAVHHAAGASTTVPHSRVGDIPALTTEAVYKVAVSLWIDARRAGMYQ